MKVQWQLVDIETKKIVKVGDEFELIDFMKQYLGRSISFIWRSNEYQKPNRFGNHLKSFIQAINNANTIIKKRYE
ncbi:hypothetical protein KA005_74430 [bacterium]|nr:hypothetical protein [bacterium]